ncbi:F-box domain [Pseudocohnilembus persalinus]|uniref:F-box domain n=1 Tax=Pseudocohnilembus persalinus TaxID=266149 RepID=A0A0V0QHG5_PSEPJ|nr:F-box domain [Pseudocohnilembus persalinus]|eukprot:KRX01679.1 F-box domain [Pseudocohnilembus persalinus]
MEEEKNQKGHSRRNSKIMEVEEKGLNKKNSKKFEIEDLEESKSQNLGKFLSQIPYEVWIKIFQFIPTFKNCLNLSKTCHLFKEICETNIIWYYIYKNTFPRQYKKLGIEESDINSINYKQKFKENQLLLNAFQEILAQLNETKEKGNEFFRQKKYEEAKSRYEQALTSLQDDKYDIKKYEDILTIEYNIKFYKIQIILYSNIALMFLKLVSYFRARQSAKQGFRKLIQIKSMLISEDESDENNEENEKLYDKHFGLLEDKLKYRLRQIEDEMPLPFSFYHHSTIPVNELRQGTMLTHTDNFGSGGIFGQSNVFMTHFDRESENFTGIIINKKIRSRDGEMIWIGGPCELSKITILHNIPNVQGARRIIEGLYEGGEIAEYEDNPNYTIKKYYGYASWFSGQLDGEIRNGNGWQHTNLVTPDHVLNPQGVINMNAGDFY